MGLTKNIVDGSIVRGEGKRKRGPLGSGPEALVGWLLLFTDMEEWGRSRARG